jgi:hypothetical protein
MAQIVFNLLKRQILSNADCELVREKLRWSNESPGRIPFPEAFGRPSADDVSVLTDLGCPGVTPSPSRD